MRGRVAVLLAGLLCASSVSALDLEAYGDLLRRYAPAGKVDHGGLKNNDFRKLEKVYRSLAREDLTALSARDDELAFWMNAYNVIVLYATTKAYPVKDVWSVRKDFFKVKHAVAGQKLSLDDIEHERIRKKFADARVHFGVHCGAVSCPLLATKPYTAGNLHEKLDLNTRLFINDDANVRFEEAKGQLLVSELFKWYADDFARDAGSVEKFLEKYLDADKRTTLAARPWKLGYIPYDWSLNAAGLR
jgi:hypothetical protein